MVKFRSGRFSRYPKLLLISIPILLVGIVYVLYAYSFAPSFEQVTIKDNPELLSSHNKGEDSFDSKKLEGTSCIVKDSPKSTLIKIDVGGAVKKPGLIEIDDADKRVSDAIDCAGGLLQEADVSHINLAGKLADGQKIYVPKRGESVSLGVSSGLGTDSSNNSPTDKININFASQEEIERLPGIGKQTAQIIIKEREKHRFKRIEDLMKISGIGKKKFEKVRDFICV